MPLTFVAAHPAARPALLDSLVRTARATELHVHTGPLTYALLSNPALSDAQTEMLLDARGNTNRNRDLYGALLRRPGVSGTQLLTFMPPSVERGLIGSYLTDYKVSAAARSALAGAYARRVLSGSPSPSTVGWSQILRSPGLDPALRRAVLDVALNDSFNPEQETTAIVYAALRTPSDLPRLIRASRNVHVTLALREASRVAKAATASGGSALHAWLDTQVPPAWTSVRALEDILLNLPDPYLAAKVLAQQDLPWERVGPVLQNPYVGRSTLDDALLLWGRHAHLDEVSSRSADGPMHWASAEFLDEFIAQVSTCSELTAVMGAAHLNAAHLDQIEARNDLLRTSETMHLPAAAVGGWKASHPGASTTQREQGLAAAAGDAFWTNVAQSGSYGGGGLNVAALSFGRSFGDRCARAHAYTYLEGVLPTLDSAAQISALVAFTPTFHGTLDELFATTADLAS